MSVESLARTGHGVADALSFGPVSRGKVQVPEVGRQAIWLAGRVIRPLVMLCRATTVWLRRALPEISVMPRVEQLHAVAEP